MRLQRRDVGMALLAVLLAVAALATGRVLMGPADRSAECERTLGSWRGSTQADIERVCSRLQ